jgi:hypothetical protein
METHKEFAEGDTVQILGGFFDGLVVPVLGIDGPNAKVLISLFGGERSVNIAADQLVAAQYKAGRATSADLRHFDADEIQRTRKAVLPSGELCLLKFERIRAAEAALFHYPLYVDLPPSGTLLFWLPLVL